MSNGMKRVTSVRRICRPGRTSQCPVARRPSKGPDDRERSLNLKVTFIEQPLITERNLGA
jgi:hypothetical protein